MEDYLEATSLHGLPYLQRKNSSCARLFWSIAVIGGGSVIYSRFSIDYHFFFKNISKAGIGITKLMQFEKLLHLNSFVQMINSLFKLFDFIQSYREIILIFIFLSIFNNSTVINF